MKKRAWSVEEKMAIVLEGLKGESTVAETYRRHQISQTLYCRWRDQFLEGVRNELEGRRKKEESVL